MNKTKIIALFVAVFGTLLFLNDYFKPVETWEELNKKGMSAFQESRYLEAEELFTKSSKRAETFPPNDLRLTFSLNQLAEIYRIQSKYTEAERVLKKLLATYKKQSGSESVDVAMTLNNLAVNYRMNGKNEEAEVVLQQALKILESSMGPEHSLVANFLEHYAYLLKTMGRTEEAEKVKQRSQEINSKTALTQK